MRASLFVFLAALVASGSALVSPELEQRLAAASTGQYLPMHVVMKEQFDAATLASLVEGIPVTARRVEVARVLGEFSTENQTALVAELTVGRARDITPLWVVNAVYCEATPGLIRKVAARSDVAYVNYDRAYSPDALSDRGRCGQPAPARDEIPWGVRRINAPAVWALGHTGQGIVVGIIDTGCDYDHPDLADHMWTDPNYPHYGWDFENDDDDPMDDHGHGTMTAGFVAADGTGGTQCGVAPDARLMACRVSVTADSIAESQCWAAMQFCVAPPLSPANGADLYCLTLGWILTWNPHQATWRTAMNNVAAAGLSQVVSAGAERGTAPPNAIRCPGNVPPPWWNPENTGVGTLSGAVACGATDSSDYLASFSSPGPVTWQGVTPYDDYYYPPGLTKPEVSAPGVNVKTTQKGGGYTVVSGTSWSTAYTAGAAALLLSEDSTLSPAKVDSLLEVSAVDLGPEGKDNDFGAGRIDVLAAVSGIEDGRQPTAYRSQLAVRPNPFRNVCRISSPAPVVVLDAAGRRVAELTGGSVWRPSAGTEPGVYFVRAGLETARVTYVR
jgi:subtilisin family serine protease